MQKVSEKFSVGAFLSLSTKYKFGGAINRMGRSIGFTGCCIPIVKQDDGSRRECVTRDLL